MSAYSITTRGLDGRKVPQGTLTAMGALLFGASEPGAWYDPSDLSTMFQDSAGTTPVTAVEQPVGRMLDKSQGLVRGAETVTNGSFADATGWTLGVGWTIGGGVAVSTASGILSSTTTMVAGKTYEITLNITAYTSGGIQIRFGGASAGYLPMSVGSKRIIAVSSGGLLEFVATTLVCSIDNVSVRELPGNHASQATSTKRSTYSRRVNLLLATATLATQSITTKAAAYTLAFSGTGSVTLSGTATGTYGAGTHAITCTSGSLTLTVSGAVTDAQCVLSIDAHLPYQWVNTATDYDADPAKFPAYLRFEVDDALQTGNIDFTSTDKMTVWAGVTKMSDAAVGLVVELSTSASSKTRAFCLFAPDSAAARYAFRSRGELIGTDAVIAGYASPVTSVLAGVGDIAGDSQILRINGTQVATSTTDQGTGNYGNYPLYIGARAGTSLYFNGRLYGLIVRGAESTLSQLEAGELYTRQKMRMP